MEVNYWVIFTNYIYYYSDMQIHSNVDPLQCC